MFECSGLIGDRWVLDRVVLRDRCCCADDWESSDRLRLFSRERECVASEWNKISSVLTLLSCRIFSIKVCDPLLRSRSSRSSFSSSSWSAADLSAWLFISLYSTGIRTMTYGLVLSLLDWVSLDATSSSCYRSLIRAWRWTDRIIVESLMFVSHFRLFGCWGNRFSLWLIDLLFLRKRIIDDSQCMDEIDSLTFLMSIDSGSSWEFTDKLALVG